MIQFSKGTIFFRKTYNIMLHAANVGGLKPRASVLMAGVQVGTVSEIRLGTQGTNVTIINNVFYNNQHGWDIQLYPNPISGLNILNNTFAFYNPWRNGQIIVSGALSNSNIAWKYRVS